MSSFSEAGFMAYAHEKHTPVLPDEVLSVLAPERGGLFLDGTLGLAGHASALLDANPEIRLVGLDQDAAALGLARQRLAPYGDRVRLHQSAFAAFADFLGREKLAGALVDLGVSSLQLDSPERGFSFSKDGPLDMRMNPDSGLASAAQLVNRAPLEKLKTIIEELGEEPQAGRIARFIVEARAGKPFETTGELAALVERAYPAKWRGKSRNHPATRTFQALRMAVNDELGQLNEFLRRIVDYLAPDGRLAVISFHSLEDRAVKRFFREQAAGCLCPPHVPVCVCGHKATLRLLTRKPLTAGPAENAANPRSASARLRAAARIAEDRV